MAKKEGRRNIIKIPFSIVSDFSARIGAYRKKGISLTQLSILFSNSKVLAQNMRNFTELYGSRWKAIQKMNEIIGGNIKRV